jgi:hypothetical protein
MDSRERRMTQTSRTGRANTFLRMDDVMRGSGCTERWKVKEKCTTPTEVGTMGNGSAAKDTVLVHAIGGMEIGGKALGLMTKSTEDLPTSTITVRRRWKIGCTTLREKHLAGNRSWVAAVGSSRRW